MITRRLRASRHLVDRPADQDVQEAEVTPTVVVVVDADVCCDNRGVHGPLALSQLNIVVTDMSAALDFYRRLGWEIELASDDHAVANLPDGPSVAFDRVGFVSMWDSGYAGQTGGSTVLGISVEGRDAVDELYAELVTAGHPGRQPPYDAFWGSRYAIVEDPDGNPVGLMSPRDDEHRSWPPSAPPRS